MTLKELKDIIAYEEVIYLPKSKKKKIITMITNRKAYRIWKLVKNLRICEYYSNKKTFYGKFMFYFWNRKVNLLGEKLNIEVYRYNFNKGIKIYHSGIVINNQVRMGENCILHGNNCIGNDGKNSGVPRIGNNVDIGFGATIIGDITIADNTIIGANSLVCKSIETPGKTVVGIPAKELR